MTNIVDMLMHFLFLVLGIVEKVVEKAGNAGVLEKVIDKAEKVIASSNEKKRERQSSSSSSSSSDSEGAKEHNQVPNTIIVIQNEKPTEETVPKVIQDTLKPKRQNQIAPRIAYKM